MIENMSKINEVLQQGGVIAYVTDTVWGVGCLPDNEEAVKKIYEIKHRDGKKPLILMSDEVYNLFDYVRQPIEKEAQKLIKKHFPGALTLVLEKSEKTPDKIHQVCRLSAYASLTMKLLQKFAEILTEEFWQPQAQIFQEKLQL